MAMGDNMQVYDNIYIQSTHHDYAYIYAQVTTPTCYRMGRVVHDATRLLLTILSSSSFLGSRYPLTRLLSCRIFSSSCSSFSMAASSAVALPDCELLLDALLPAREVELPGRADSGLEVLLPGWFNSVPASPALFCDCPPPGVVGRDPPACC